MSTELYCRRSESIKLLQDERLAWLTTLDTSICLEFRPSNTLTLYYRGKRLLTLEYRKRKKGYKPSYTPIFAQLGFEKIPSCLEEVFLHESQVSDLLKATNSLCKGIDKWYMTTNKGEHRTLLKRLECEISQNIVFANNRGPRAANTQFYFCDSEYQRGDFRGDGEIRPDLIGVHWPTKRLVLCEVKRGERALKDKKNKSGLADHVKAFDDYLGRNAVIKSFRNDMKELFNRKRELGLIMCEDPIHSFELRPIILLILIDQNSRSKILMQVLNNIESVSNAELSIVCYDSRTATDYGLYDESICSISQFINNRTQLI